MLMKPEIVLIVLIIYFLLLVGISIITSRGANSESYFLGNKKSPWIAVAFGMIGDSLSGVTFISVPGAVGNAQGSQFSYMQVVFGYLCGYLIISKVLLPLYYRLNLTSIYSYLGIRFGTYAEKTGSVFFLISRLLGAGGRLYLAVLVMHHFVLEQMHVPFSVSVAVIIFLMLVYTYKGGIKTLVWTDVLQSSLLLAGVVLSIFAIKSSMGISMGEMVNNIWQDEHTKTFFWDWKETVFFPKMFIGGALMSLAMTGLDQNMMQKNLSCPSLKDAQKNITWFSIVLVFVNLFFLSLGVLLYQYYAANNIPLPMKDGQLISDFVFPNLTLGNYLGMFAGMVFIIGLTAATFSSADSVLTTLTTSFYIDMLKLDKDKDKSEVQKKKIRNIIHISFAVLMLLVILVFEVMNDDAIINTILYLASFTYGPLLGMFFFGILNKRKADDKMIPLIAVLAPVICYVLAQNSVGWFGGYKFGYELLGVNALLVYAGMYFFSEKKEIVTH